MEYNLELLSMVHKFGEGWTYGAHQYLIRSGFTAKVEIFQSILSEHNVAESNNVNFYSCY